MHRPAHDEVGSQTKPLAAVHGTICTYHQQRGKEKGQARLLPDRIEIETASEMMMLHPFSLNGVP